MLDFVRNLFASGDFMPHGHCYFWQPEILWLHVVSDALVALSYTTIPFTLFYFTRKRRDLPFHWMFLCFAVFIIACGATHAMEIWTVWNPTYRVSGVVKAITAMASVPTAILLITLVPTALALPSPQALRKVNGELAATAAQLEIANKELEAFSYSVAHDLRAPLRAMNGFAQLLASDSADKLDAQSLDHLQEIRSNADKMASLIDAMLLLSRVTRHELKTTPLDLSELGGTVAKALKAANPERTVELVVQPNLSCAADPTLARTLLENLLGNAWKFTGKVQAPRVELGSETQNGERIYYVRDNGAGFDPTYAEKLFKAFQRLHHQNDFAGTGIGLATVHRIVTRHGGRVWAQSAVGQGATFYFTFSKPEQTQEAAE